MKFVLKPLLILLLLSTNLCFAQVILRFQPHIDTQALVLGDLLQIENDEQHWADLPLQSHPTPGEIIAKDTLLEWLKPHLEKVDIAWQGKTHIQVKQSKQSSQKMLIEKAKAALMNQLAPHYLRVEMKAISNLKDSEYALDALKAEPIVSFPTPKRVCVWLTPKRHHNQRIAVWFKVHAYARVLVANRHVRYNTPLSSDAFVLKERDIAGLNGQPIHDLPQAAWLKSSIEPDGILLENQLKKPPLVVKGQPVKVELHHHQITIVMDAVALSDGDLGETITVKNPLNHKTFVVRISGFQQAEMTS